MKIVIGAVLIHLLLVGCSRACSSDEDPCGNGCMPKGNTCCGGSGSCSTGQCVAYGATVEVPIACGAVTIDLSTAPCPSTYGCCFGAGDCTATAATRVEP